jgi:hypothetical protein
MDVPLRVIYSKICVPAQESQERATVVEAVDISASGSYNYQYNTTKGPCMLTGVDSSGVLQKLCEAIPETIFSPELAAICRTKFINAETRSIKRISLSYEYQSGTSGEILKNETALEWDWDKTFFDFPVAVLTMLVSFHKTCHTLKKAVK